MYSFSLILDVPEATVEDADALYGVCDGVLLRSSGGRTVADIDCEAQSMETAVDTAITQVEQALPHAHVVRIEVDRSDLKTSPAA